EPGFHRPLELGLWKFQFLPKGVSQGSAFPSPAQCPQSSHREQRSSAEKGDQIEDRQICTSRVPSESFALRSGSPFWKFQKDSSSCPPLACFIFCLPRGLTAAATLPKEDALFEASKILLE